MSKQKKNKKKDFLSKETPSNDVSIIPQKEQKKLSESIGSYYRSREVDILLLYERLKESYLDESITSHFQSKSDFRNSVSLLEKDADIIVEKVDSLAKKATFRQRYNTFEALKNEQLEPLEFVVNDVLPSSGAFVLSAKPKVGKTSLALDIAFSIATGSKAVEHFNTKKGEVFYTMTQGGKRVLKNRGQMLTDTSKDLSDFFYTEKLPPLSDGGYQALQRWIDEADKPRLIVLDMITNLIPNIKHSNYQGWSAVFEDLNTFAIDNDICILCVYHSKKSVSDDAMDDVIGSTGLLGSVSGTLVLRRMRQKDKGELYITLREAESRKYVLDFSNATWSYITDKMPKTELQQQIYKMILETQGITNQEIADTLEKDRGNVKRTLDRLIDQNFIYLDANKRYYSF